jgi:hypothetical protein
MLMPINGFLSHGTTSGRSQALGAPGIAVSCRGADRRCLRTADRNEAERLGKELLAALLRNEDIEPSPGLSLVELWTRCS